MRDRIVRALDNWVLMGLVLVASLAQGGVALAGLLSSGHGGKPYTASQCLKIFPRPHNPYDYALARDMARFRSACVRGAKLPR